MNKTHPKTLASTIARVVHTLLAAEHFDSLADLTDALKWKLAKAHIQWTHDDLNAAYRIVASARALPSTPLPRKTDHVEREPDVVVSRAEAAAILERLGVRV